MAVTLNGITFEPTVVVVDGLSLDLTYNEGVVINGVSDVQCHFNVTDTEGQSIKEFVVYNGGVAHAGADGLVNISNVYNGSFTFKVTTTTGVTATTNVKLAELTYFPITCALEVSDVEFETDTQATVTYRLSGRYYNDSLGTKNNTLNAEYSYYIGNTPPSSTTWTRITPVKDGHDYSANIDISALYTDTITLSVRVYDEITNSSTSLKYKITPVFDWSETDFNFNVPVYYKGVAMPMLEESGADRYWEWRKYSDGTVEMWATVSLVGIGISKAWGGMYSSGKLADTNLPFPFTFKQTPTLIANLVPGYAGAILMSTGDSSTPLSTTSTGTYELARGSALNSGSYKICYYVRGYWK